VANPTLAPYGAAAITVLTHLHLLEALRPKLVQGENVSQTLEFVTTGNAELGFVALSQILLAGKTRAGSYWLVPEALYAPIVQDDRPSSPNTKDLRRLEVDGMRTSPLTTTFSNDPRRCSWIRG
jgi:hypothetical protein